jgi:hypothetical protein
VWSQRADELSAAIDEHLWDPTQRLWSDAAVIGPAASTAVPTLDGALPALATKNPDLAAQALDQLEDETRFAAPFGLAYVARDHRCTDPICIGAGRRGHSSITWLG